MPPKVLKEKPPVWDQAKQLFGFDDQAKLIFAYGDVIYNPNEAIVTNAILAHELTHLRQQDGKPAEWWDRYFIDTEFRLDQELEAYSVQYLTFCHVVKDRNRRYQCLHEICVKISSPMYGNMILYSEAMDLLKQLLSTTGRGVNMV